MLRRSPTALAVAAGVALLLLGCTSDDDSGADDAPSADDAPGAEDGADLDADEADAGDAGDETTGETDEADVAEDEGSWEFAAGDEIPATLTLLDSDDGGRQTGYFGGYRPDVTFATGTVTMTCTLGGPPEGGSFEPGETHDIEMTCEDDVTVEPEAAEFVVNEGGREVGAGTVSGP